MSQYNHCIVTQWDGRLVWLVKCFVTEREGEAAGQLYCNSPKCIVTSRGWLLGFLYRNTLKCIVTRGARGKAAVSRPGPRHGQPGARHKRLRHGHTRCDTAGGQATIRPNQPTTRHDRAHLGAPVCAGWSAGCALGAASLFLDSILFLSHCLDHCSQKIFEKKN